MAVQKSRKTRSKRGMRRSHDALTAPAITEDASTGEVHRRHHCLLYTSPSPRDGLLSRMPSSA